MQNFPVPHKAPDASLPLIYPIFPRAGRGACVGAAGAGLHAPVTVGRDAGASRASAVPGFRLPSPFQQRQLQAARRLGGI